MNYIPKIDYYVPSPEPSPRYIRKAKIIKESALSLKGTRPLLPKEQPTEVVDKDFSGRCNPYALLARPVDKWMQRFSEDAD